VTDEITGTHRKTFEGNPHVAVALWEAGGGGSEVCHGPEGRAKTEVADTSKGGGIFAQILIILKLYEGAGIDWWSYKALIRSRSLLKTHAICRKFWVV